MLIRCNVCGIEIYCKPLVGAIHELPLPDDLILSQKILVLVLWLDNDLNRLVSIKEYSKSFIGIF